MPDIYKTKTHNRTIVVYPQDDGSFLVHGPICGKGNSIRMSPCRFQSMLVNDGFKYLDHLDTKITKKMATIQTYWSTK